MDRCKQKERITSSWAVITHAPKLERILDCLQSLDCCIARRSERLHTSSLCTSKSESPSVMLGLMSVLTVMSGTGMVNLANISSVHWPIVRVQNCCHSISSWCERNPGRRSQIITTLVGNIGRFQIFHISTNYSRLEQLSRTCHCHAISCVSIPGQEVKQTSLKLLDRWWVRWFDGTFYRSNNLFLLTQWMVDV